MGLSVTDPISRAIDRAKLITFQPFDLAKWFTLGFIVWIANLGESGSGNYNFNNGGSGGRRATTSPTTMPSAFQQTQDWVGSHLGVVILIAVGALLLFTGIALVILWLTSRGKFIYLRAVATNTVEIQTPWSQFRDLANSLFGFRVAVMAIAWAIILLVTLISLTLAWSDIHTRHFSAASLGAIVFAGVVLLPTMFVLGLVTWAMNTFCTIIMYARGVTAMEAWREFRQAVLPGNVGSFVLFILMQLVLGIGVGLLGIIAGCATCCIGFLPYLSTVITLPLSIFWRCYSIYFLQQLGPQYVIIEEHQPPAPVYGFPTIPYTPPTNPPMQ
jgi:hypothetical protein